MDILEDLLEEGYESERLDFKATEYRTEQRENIIKDIMAMANSLCEDDKYIITGVKDRNGTCEILGIDESFVTDDSNYQQLILDNIEPDVRFSYFTTSYQGKKLGVFHIYGNIDRPYMLKKKTGSLRKGFCLIRKGSQQSEVSRSDLDKMYSGRGKFEIRVLEQSLNAVHSEEGCADIKVSLRNLTKYPVTLIDGNLIVRNIRGEEASCHRVNGLDKFYGAEFTINLAPHSEQAGYLFVEFNSTSCLRLGLNKDGFTDERFTIDLVLADTLSNEYRVMVDDCRVFATDKFLWKVQSLPWNQSDKSDKKGVLGRLSRS